MKDLIDRQAAIKELRTRQTYLFDTHDKDLKISLEDAEYCIERLPPAQPEYKPATAEDFAKTMSENTLCSFMAWHGKALALMKEQGFVICKKMM